ncbi:hypothetical protein RCL1_006511 [Eukaryota sp. TZLM3-RCL]
MQPPTSNIPEYLRCKKCHRVFDSVNPHISPCCNSLICDACLEQDTRTEPIGLFTCACGRSYSRSEVKAIPDDILQLLNSLEIPCSYCGSLFRRNELREHLRAEAEQHCQGRRVESCEEGSSIMCECSLCHHCILRSNYQQHLAVECPDQTVSCPLNCGFKGKRRTLHEHAFRCPHEVVRCAAYDFGCLFQETRSKMIQHEQECKVLQTVSKLQVTEYELRECRAKLAEHEEESQLVTERERAQRRGSLPLSLTTSMMRVSEQQQQETTEKESKDSFRVHRLRF